MKFIENNIFNVSDRIIRLYRIYSKSTCNKILRKLLFHYTKRHFGCEISPLSKIGEGIKFPHPYSIVIGNNVVIGKNCKVYQCVTFGAGGKIVEGGVKYPYIGDNCTIYAGAKIIGGIKIGDNCIVGANAVVVHDVPSGCTVVGVPARVIKNKYE